MIRTVRGLLLLAATILSSSLFAIVFFSLATAHEQSIRRDAVDSARTLARVTFSTMYELMRTGWTDAQLQAFAQALGGAVADSPSRIHIHRGEPVDRLFGPIEQPQPDAPLREAMKTGAGAEEHSGDSVRFIFPLRAEPVCLRCHTNAATGDVLGAIVVEQTVAAALADNRSRTLTALLPAIPIALLATFAMAAFINRRLLEAIGGLRADMASINRVADLDRLASREQGLGFAEFDVLADGIRQLTGRLHGVAVDRGTLELELRLLERLVVTTEVARDWRDHVQQLLRDIHEVLPSRMLFTVFRTDDRYCVEVFWLNVPDESCRMRLEDGLRATLQAHFPDPFAARPAIVHNAGKADDAAPGDELTDYRTLFLPAPRIGGILGVGLAMPQHAEGDTALAIDGVLSSLLNVVGSVRAIDRYTSELEHHATRDPLTGLFNQRVIRELLEAERTRAARHGRSFGVLLIDVDHFKSINDRFGHDFGDRYMQRFAATVRKALRAEDALGRYGGDEFVAIMPAADLSAAVRAGRRVLEAVRGIRMEADDGTRVKASASIGVAVYPIHGMDGRELFLFADRMLYRAKAAGRNRLAAPGETDIQDLAEHAPACEAPA